MTYSGKHIVQEIHCNKIMLQKIIFLIEKISNESLAFCINCGTDTTEEFCTSCGDKVIGFDDSMSVLVKNGKNIINESETRNIIKLWNSVTKFATSDEDTTENKFQSIREKNDLQNRLETMLNKSSKEILILGTQSALKKIINQNILKILANSIDKVRILTNNQTEKQFMFADFPSEKIKKLEDIDGENFCFIIKDDYEAIFFINNSESKDKLAIFTSSKSFSITLKSLFNVLWNKSDNPESEIKNEVEMSFDERLRELEQKKIILGYLQSVFKLTEAEMTNSR